MSSILEQRSSFSRQALVLLVLLALGLGAAVAQSPQKRINSAVVDSQRVTLSGHTFPLARDQYDQGALEDSAETGTIMLMLSRTDAQEQALQKLLAEQQDPTSANYHKWLTPSEFGEKFGASDSDVAAIRSWLASKGFTVGTASNSRMLISFSGTAAQLRSAFNVSLHNYKVGGISFVSTSTEPQIPAALAGVIKRFVSLNNYPKQNHSHLLHEVSGSNVHGPTANYYSTLSGYNYVGPGDFSIIYGSKPLLASGITGSGVKIGIVGRSNITMSDVTSYRSAFGLNTVDSGGSVNYVTVGTTDPGILYSSDAGEATLDVTWSSAVAPGATVTLYSASSTNTVDGVDLSAVYIVDNDLADIVSESYGQCEPYLGGTTFFTDLWQQAAAQGITVLVSAGDNGSAGCTSPGLGTSGEYYSGASTAASGTSTGWAINGNTTDGGIFVSGLASTPYNVAVGGTDFQATYSNSTYWNTGLSSNGSTDSTGLTYVSAKSYIPEMTWNDSCAYQAATGSLTVCSGVSYHITSATQVYGDVELWSGSGGPSNCANLTYSYTGNTYYISCTSGYSKPSWQTGTGVPSDGVRDIPDVSFLSEVYTSNSKTGYVVYFTSSSTSGRGTAFFGGTSAAAPAFAGALALAEQKIGNQRLGNVNYLLYKLAAVSGNTCTSSTSASETTGCIFHDVVTGNNSVPCTAGSPNCSLATGGTNYGVLVSSGTPAYTTTSGYDLATGLGSLNITNFAAAVANLAVPTLSTVTASSNPVAPNSATTLSVTVTGNSTLGAPSGTITFYNGTTLLGTATTSSSSTAYTLTGTLSYTPTTAGTVTVTAHYSGDNYYIAGVSSPLDLTVSTGTLPNPTIVAPTVGTTPLKLGNSTALSVSVTGTSTVGSAPSGTITFYNGGTVIGTATTSTSGLVLTGNYTYTPTDVGTQSIIAIYSGDTNYAAATSASKSLLVYSGTPNVAAPTATSNPVAVGSPTTLSVTVTGTTGVGVPTGAITFYNGGVTLGTATTSASGVVLTGTYSYTPTAIGAQSITASYAGDSNYSSASSGVLSLTVSTAMPTIATPTAAASSVTAGVATSLSVTVTGSSVVGSAPTGTITFYDGSTTVGTASTTTSGYVLTGTVSYTPASAGSHSITAQYAGDTNYRSGTSAALAVTANPAFTAAAASSALTLTGGGTGSTSITFTPATGFTGTVSYYCTSNSTAASCTPTSTSTGSVSLASGAAAGTISYTIPTRNTSANHTPAVPWKTGGGIVVGGVFLFSLGGVRRRSRAAIILCLMAATLAVMSGCSGGSSTPSSSYTFTVTATTTINSVTSTQTSTSFTVSN